MSSFKFSKITIGNNDFMAMFLVSWIPLMISPFMLLIPFETINPRVIASLPPSKIPFGTIDARAIPNIATRVETKSPIKIIIFWTGWIRIN